MRYTFRTLRFTSSAILSLVISLSILNSQNEPLKLHLSDWITPYQSDSLAVKVYQGLENPRFFKLNSGALDFLQSNVQQNLRIEAPDGNGNSFWLNLNERQIFAQDFRLTTSDGQRLDIEKGRHFGGNVEGYSQSFASMSAYTHQIAILYSGPWGNIVVAPLETEEGNFSDVYVAYNDKDLKVKNDFVCHTPDDEVEIESWQDDSNGNSRSNNTCRQIRVYMEASHKTYQDRSSSVSNVQTFFTNFFNQVATLYNNEQITTVISEIFVWTTPDNIPTASSGAALTAFGQMRTNSFNGDLAHWVTTGNFQNGGIAWLDVLCAGFNPANGYGRFAYSNISNNFQTLPTYSWTVMVFAHEMGHNVGSPHTHNCSWPGGAIDSCYQVEGNCYSGPVIPRQGTIMSYCHLTNQGINLGLGFGTHPGNQLRSRTFGSNASCLANLPGTEPNATITHPACAGDTIFFQSTNNPGTIYQWSGPGGFQFTGSQGFIPNAAATNQGIYTVQAITAGCTAEQILYVQVVNSPANPTIAIIGDNLQIAPYTIASYQWHNQNGPIAGANSHIFTPTESGDYFITVVVGNCQFQLTSNTVSFMPSSVENLSNSVSVFPNPTYDYIEIHGIISKNTVHYSIIDANGRKVKRGSIPLESVNKPFKINLSNLSSGVYWLSLDTDESNLYTKILLFPR
jgi:hypothetical protein